jgi:FolB domain-containing protein
MDQIFIKDLLCRGVIGITDQERTKPQNILVNIVLFTDTSAASRSDSIENCVNYSTVAEQIYTAIEKASRFTVEALAGDIAKICLDFRGVQKCRVRIEKPGVVRFASSVGIEIERENG